MPASPIDLTTLAAVKQWLSANGVSSTNTADDDEIQACITTFSAVFIWQTGMGPANGDLEANLVSPFVEPISYSEVYDGSGSSRIFLKNKPIQSVQSLVIGFQTIQPSTGFGIAGWVIDGSGASISLRCGGGQSFSTFYPLGGYGIFWMGLQNVAVTYTAGYTATPPDIELAARKTAALNYKRSSWIGLRSKGMGSNAGTTTYTEFEYDPDVARLIAQYSRWAIV